MSCCVESVFSWNLANIRLAITAKMSTNRSLRMISHRYPIFSRDLVLRSLSSREIEHSGNHPVMLIWFDTLTHLNQVHGSWSGGQKYLLYAERGGNQTYLGSFQKLLNLRALKFSPVDKIYIFQCMCKIFCVEFQRYPLKIRTKYLTHTLKDVDFINLLIFKSS